ncbi:aspartate/glutamate racemase family protein [Billgrantia sp. LNSP4103-1]|uniref:aspartate/glutamate racemase family protein n=1 Tax=Billgrantia sp. LNSP4103-1 TaxID=3410266 RepID=UPI00403FAA7A
MTKIALIHATPLAIEPIHRAFGNMWPDAELMNLLDDSLSKDRNRIHDDEAFFDRRIDSLSRYVMDCHADGILFTCSAFGQAIEKVAGKHRIPILKPNEAMFRLALEQGTRIGMVATFKPALQGMVEEFETMKRQLGRADAVLETSLVEKGRRALDMGDTEQHDRLVAQAASRMPECDVYMLAHFSTASAKLLVEQAIHKGVLSSPESAVVFLRKQFPQAA